MGLLFDELAAKELPWYCNVNMYSIGSPLEARFMKNWRYIFVSGLGIKNIDQMTYLIERFNNGMSYADISIKYGVSESAVHTLVDSHLEELLSPRALTLFEQDYPLQLKDMKKHQYNGFYDNYAEWHEPDYKSGSGFKNISLFDIFDNYYFRNLAKKNEFKCMDDVCTWIDENVSDIRKKKAGIGKSTAALLLTNKYVVNGINPDSLSTLQKISVK